MFLSVVQNCKQTVTMDFDGIVIVGGGIAGLATALALHRVGMRRILVLERAESLRASGTAIGMWSNGWKALDALGVAQTLRQQHCLLLNSKLISRSDGTTVNVPIDARFQELRFVRRALLLEALASGLPPEAIKFNCKVVDVRQCPHSKLMWKIELEDGSIIKAKGVIACDGVNSLLAESILGLPRAISSAQCAVRGLSSYPEGHPFQPTRQLHMAKGFLFGMIPVTEKEVYWFISTGSTPPDIWEIMQDPVHIAQWSEAMLKDFPEEIREMVKKTGNDVIDMTILKFRRPWSMLMGRLYEGTMTAVGDAMHPMTPYVAQGGCSALEDAIVLARCFVHVEEDSTNKLDVERITEAFKKYTKERRWRWIRLMSQSYITGIVQEGSNIFLRFIRDKIMLRIKIPNPSDFDCGNLPTTTHLKSSLLNE